MDIRHNERRTAKWKKHSRKMSGETEKQTKAPSISYSIFQWNSCFRQSGWPGKGAFSRYRKHQRNIRRTFSRMYGHGPGRNACAGLLCNNHRRNGRQQFQHTKLYKMVQTSKILSVRGWGRIPHTGGIHKWQTDKRHTAWTGS